MNKVTILSIAIAGLFLTACNGSKKEKKQENQTVQTEVKTTQTALPVLQKQWELDGFSMPESVFAEPNSDWIYVSNVNNEKTGFISRVSKSGKIDKLHWVDEIQNPTGMAEFNGKLYVVNATEIVEIDIQTAKITQGIVSDAKMLNDIAVTPNGRFYIGDLMSGGIYTFKVGDSRANLWLKSPKITTPNGMLIDGNELIVGTVGTRLSQHLSINEFGSPYTINLNSKAINLVKSTAKLGSLDGLIKFKNGFLITASMQGKTYFVNKNKISEINQARQGKITDFGLSEDNMYAPYMFENKLVKYKIIRK